jgi:uncharacterized protein
MKKLAWILVIIGALNWGLVGLGAIFGGGNWNLVNLVFGNVPNLEAIVYLLVGVSAVVSIFGCKSCQGGNCKTHGNMGGGQNHQQM